MRRHAIGMIGLLMILLVFGLGCQLVSELLEVFEPEPIQRPAPQPQSSQPLAPEPLQPPASQPQRSIRIDLVGIWQSQMMTEYGNVYAEIILQRNGTYSYQVRWGELMTWEVGTYQVVDGFIHFVLQDYGPREYKGKQMHRPQSWGVFYTVVDENTMTWEDRIGGTRWMVQRRR